MGICICCKTNPSNRDYCKTCARTRALTNTMLISQIKILETASNNWRLKYFKLKEEKNGR